MLASATLAGCQASGDTSTLDPASSEVHVSAPESGSPRALALAAMARADVFQLYSLQPWEPPAPAGQRPPYGSPELETFERAEAAAWRRSEKEWCTRDACLARNKILGTAIVQRSDVNAVRQALGLSLSQVPDYATACIPEYRHAVAYESDGHRYEVLLCYECGQVGIVLDGKEMLEADQTYEMGDEKALNAILERAGVPLAKDAANG